jgi:hypothetical protein
MYFLPSQRGWKLILNKQIKEEGNIYDEKQDLGRVDMTAGRISEPPVERLTVKLKAYHQVYDQRTWPA